MVIADEALVLSALKYGDTNLIVKCYTKQEGLKSFMLFGVLKSKKKNIAKSHFLPLNILKINAHYNQKGNLNKITESNVKHHLNSFFINPVKQSVLYFIAEILENVLHEQADELLFDFLENAILWFDMQESFAEFHLLFLVELTKYIGFYPDLKNLNNTEYFDLKDACYTHHQGLQVINGESLLLFIKCFDLSFSNDTVVFKNKNERNQALQIIFQYYQLHIANFRKPTSLSILTEILA